jgi:hypothetical protein
MSLLEALISGKATNMAHIHLEEAQWPKTSESAHPTVPRLTRVIHRELVLGFCFDTAPRSYINTRRRRFNSLFASLRRSPRAKP